MGSIDVVPEMKAKGPAQTTRLYPHLASNGEGGSPASRLIAAGSEAGGWAAAGSEDRWDQLL